MSKQTIGEFLAIQRKARGLTQQEVADMLGISNKTLSSWESGRSYPDILALPALAEIYGVTVDEIVNGERTVRGGEAGEMRERPQKNLLKNAANRYSVKCATLTGIGIGGVGLFALALCLGFVAAWLFLLFAVLSLLTEAATVILFVVFEKSALLIEEEKSRYSLIIKRMTYKAACKIVGALIIPAVIFPFVFRRAINFGVTGNLVLAIVSLIVLALAALFLRYLSGRGKEFFTQEESAARARNQKCAVKFFSIGAAISAVLFVTTSVLSEVGFTHTEKSLVLPKDAFVRLVQSIEVSEREAKDYGIETGSDGKIGEYFVDIKAALSKPIEMTFLRSMNTFIISREMCISII